MINPLLASLDMKKQFIKDVRRMQKEKKSEREIAAGYGLSVIDLRNLKAAIKQELRLAK